MSTRATYSLPANPEGTIHDCFYIHHDGYLAGAAQYFKEMLKVQMRVTGPLSWSFQKANEAAEETNNHESHLDTKYRYHVTIEPNPHKDENDIILTAYCSKYDDEFNSYWKIVYRGDLKCFINYYAPDKPETNVYTVLKEESANIKNRKVLTNLLKSQLEALKNQIDIVSHAIDDLNTKE
jgi:hypothetical protein